MQPTLLCRTIPFVRATSYGEKGGEEGIVMEGCEGLKASDIGQA
jgi:hypothetical protein